MKIYLGIVGILLVLGLVKCGELREDMKHLIAECKKEIGEVVPKEGPPNFEEPKVKCFAACLLKKEGSMVDGQIIAEKAQEYSAKQSSGAVGDSTSGIAECVDKANEEKEECDVGGAFHKCMMERHSN